MHKKSQSISINTIIIAAIALAVLVVIFLIFTGKLKIFNEGVSGTVTCQNSCTSLGKTMYSSGTPRKEDCQSSSNSNLIYVPGTYDDIKPNFCCCQ